MDDFGLGAGQQQRCPQCSTVMVDLRTVTACRNCGYSTPIPTVDMPPDFTGPTIHGG